MLGQIHIPVTKKWETQEGMHVGYNVLEQPGDKLCTHPTYTGVVVTL